MRYIFGTVAIALALAAAPAGAGPDRDRPQGFAPVGAEALFVERELIVRFEPGVTAAEQAEIAATRGGSVRRALLLPRTKLVRLPAGASVQAAAAALSRRADVEFAEPNWIYRIATTPNDPRFGELHGLNQANDADIDAPQAWDVTTGSSNVIVAVIDSGVAYQHPDLAGNMWQNDDPPGGGDDDTNGFVDDLVGWDFIQNDNTPFDYNGHGTHVAGTIGAQGNNALGVTGVNWDVSIMALRAGDANGSLPNSAVANAITYACANGADIVNGSFGGSTSSALIQSAVNSAPCQSTLFVFAAGNDNKDLDGSGSAFDAYPCELHKLGSTNVLCIGATTSTDTKASFSNHGTTAVHLFAPGVDILSSWPAFQTIWGPDGFDDASDPLFDARWGMRTSTTGDQLWNRTTAVKDSGTHSLTDSPAGLYADNTDTTILRLAPFSLAGQTGCRAFYDLRLESELGFDGLILMTGTSNTTPTNAGSVSGSTAGAFIPFSTNLSMMDGQATVYLRLRFFSDVSVNGDGVYVDDLSVGCLNHGGEDYDSISGTSMATPHAAGVAALLLAQNPSRSVSDLKTLLTTSADPIAALNGFGINAARLNACKALGGTCDDTAPETTIDAGPSGATNDPTSTFVFSASESGTTFQCRVDSDPFAACTSPHTTALLPEGSHTFEARAIDLAGNPDPTPASRSFTIDSDPGYTLWPEISEAARDDDPCRAKRTDARPDAGVGALVQRAARDVRAPDRSRRVRRPHVAAREGGARGRAVHLRGAGERSSPCSWPTRLGR